MFPAPAKPKPEWVGLKNQGAGSPTPGSPTGGGRPGRSLSSAEDPERSYLAEEHPDALAYSQQSGFSKSAIGYMSKILRLARERSIELQPSQISTDVQIDQGSFGQIFHGTMSGRPVVLKRVEKV